MINRKEGKVIKVTASETYVEIIPPESCKNCSGCATKKNQVIITDNANNISIGDFVNVTIKPSAFLKAGFFLFIFPVIGLFLGIGIAYYFFHSDFAYFTGGATGIVVSFFVLKLFATQLSVRGQIVKRTDLSTERLV